MSPKPARIDIADLAMALTVLIWSANNRRGVGKTVVLLFFEPVITGILAVLFLDEKLTARKLAGAVLVMAGVQFARSLAGRKIGLGFGRRRTVRTPPLVPAPSEDCSTL